MTHLRLSEDWRCQFHTMSLLPFHIQCLRNLFLQTELFCISLEPAETRSTRCTSENNSNFESSILGHILKEQTLKSMHTEKIRFLQISLPEYYHTCLVAAYTLFIYRGSVELTPNFLVYEHTKESTNVIHILDITRTTRKLILYYYTVCITMTSHCV